MFVPGQQTKLLLFPPCQLVKFHGPPDAPLLVWTTISEYSVPMLMFVKKISGLVVFVYRKEQPRNPSTITTFVNGKTY